MSSLGPRGFAPPPLWLAAALTTGALALGFGLLAPAASGWLVHRAAAAAAARGVTLVTRASRLDWRGALVLEQLSLSGRFGDATAADLRIVVDWRKLLAGELRPQAIDLTGIAGHSAAAGPFPELDWELTTARLERADGSSLRWHLSAFPAAGGAIHGELDTEGGFAAELILERLTDESLPRALLDRLPVSMRGLADGALRLARSADGREAELALRLDCHDLTVEDPRLAAESVGPLPVSLALYARRTGDGLLLDQATLRLGLDGQAEVTVTGRTMLTADAPLELVAKLDVPDAASLADALPAALQQPPGAPPVAGPLTGTLSLSGPRQSPADWVVATTLDLTGLRATVRAAPPLPLAGPFLFRPLGPDGRDGELAILVGPDNPDFVPLAALPGFVADAVITSEDGGFLRHAGFDFAEIKDSLLAAVQLGRAVRGGSTISQQLAKNLFLTRERTYARKAREAWATLGLEVTLSKERLLEIYLNIVEWGPGIYGVGPAALAYFGKQPQALTPAEAAFLASAIPDPLRRYAEWQRGEIAPHRAARVTWVLARMTERGQLTAGIDLGLRALLGPEAVPILGGDEPEQTVE